MPCRLPDAGWRKEILLPLRPGQSHRRARSRQDPDHAGRTGLGLRLERTGDGDYRLVDDGSRKARSRILYHVDSAEQEQGSRTLTISGWAAVAGPDMPDQRIDVFLTAAGGERCLGVCQMPRPDVTASDPRICSSHAGFYCVIDLGSLTEPAYGLEAAVARSSGFHRVSYPGTVMVGEEKLRRQMKLMRGYAQSNQSGLWFEEAQRFFLHEDLSALDPDPHGVRYREQQVQLYCRLAGKEGYDSRHAEIISHDIADYLDPRPFPCCTGNLEHVGNHLLQSGFLFKSLGLGEGDAVLEYGAGCGFLTMLLAASGLDVSAVDINPDCVRIIEAIARNRGLKIATLAGEFGEAPPGQGPFDAIVFFESFHHCLEFDSVLDRLHGLLKDGGRLLFACEPISDDFPKPWGVRLDGQSVFEIVNKGWLELGFREDFFCELLHRHGWAVEKQEHPGAPPIYVAAAAR